MKKIVLFFLIVLILILSGAFLLLGYLGLLPGISNLLVKQKDLGVEVNPNLVVSLYDEVGFMNNILSLEEPTSSDLIYTGVRDLSREFSSEELSSMLSSWSMECSYVPFRNAQVKISDDGTVEFSAILLTNSAVDLANRLGYSDEQIETAKNFVNLISDEIPFYIKGNGGAINNSVNINPSVMQLGNVKIPSSYFPEISAGIEDSIERRASQVEGLFARELSFNQGKMNFEGTIPSAVDLE